MKRAQRGGMLTGTMLAAVASLLTGAAKLQRGVISAAASAREGGRASEDSPVWPILGPLKVSAGLLKSPGHLWLTALTMAE